MGFGKKIPKVVGLTKPYSLYKKIYSKKLKKKISMIGLVKPELVTDWSNPNLSLIGQTES